MKRSHTTTPRTLADCQWTQGYPAALDFAPPSWPARHAARQRRERIARAADRAVVAIGLVALCLIGWLIYRS